MEKELDQVIKEILENNIIKVVLSNSKESKYKKIVVTKTEQGYQAEKFTETQAFHENIKDNQLAVYCYTCMDTGFKQLNAWDSEYEYSIKISKKGKVFANKTKSSVSVKANSTNNRQKSYFLEEGTVIPPLVDMGIFSKNGKVIGSMYDKTDRSTNFSSLLMKLLIKRPLRSLILWTLDVENHILHLSFITI